MLRTQIVGKKLIITDALENKIMEKVYHLDNTFIHNKEDAKLHISLFLEKEKHCCRIRFSTKRHIEILTKESEDMYKSIGLAFDALERQLRKNKEKHIEHLRLPKNKDVECNECDEYDEYDEYDE